MTENNIKLVNEDGKIVGKDPETGETVPVELGETVTESLSTEQLSDGIAGSENTISAIAGDSGERDWYATFVSKDSSSTDSDTYDEVEQIGYWNRTAFEGRTNVTHFAFALAARFKATDGGTTASVALTDSNGNNLVEIQGDDSMTSYGSTNTIPVSNFSGFSPTHIALSAKTSGSAISWGAPPPTAHLGWVIGDQS